jgi:hypothetical protein
MVFSEVLRPLKYVIFKYSWLPKMKVKQKEVLWRSQKENILV